MTTTNLTAETYLADLSIQLAPLAPSDREEILREIAAHIRDSAETGKPIETVLAHLGAPAQLASEYRDSALIRSASRSFSPIKLLRATLRVATKGVSGIVVFFCGFIGYVTGGTLVIGGLLKPYAPDYIGLFTTNVTKSVWENLGLVTGGIRLDSTRHEIFGVWGIPIALVSGVIILLLTTQAIRGFLRLSQKVQRSL